jgi:hypothetical protein
MNFDHLTPGKWMSVLKSWVRFEKHPETPRQIFINVHEYDRVRRVLTARCKVCDYVVSRDPKAVRELSMIGEVCNLCYDMYHALYVNYGLRNMNYFKEIDARERRDNDDKNRRDKLGL